MAHTRTKLYLVRMYFPLGTMLFWVIYEGCRTRNYTGMIFVKPPLKNIP